MRGAFCDSEGLKHLRTRFGSFFVSCSRFLTAFSYRFNFFRGQFSFCRHAALTLKVGFKLQHCLPPFGLGKRWRRKSWPSFKSRQKKIPHSAPPRWRKPDVPSLVTQPLEPPVALEGIAIPIAPMFCQLSRKISCYIPPPQICLIAAEGRGWQDISISISLTLSLSLPPSLPSSLPPSLPRTLPRTLPRSLSA